jgi:hypothetical protein
MMLKYRKIQAQTSFSAGLVRLQGRVRVIRSTFLYLGNIRHPRVYSGSFGSLARETAVILGRGQKDSEKEDFERKNLSDFNPSETSCRRDGRDIY